MSNKLPILFASGSASLSEEYEEFLKDLAEILKKFPSITIKVNGIADSIVTKETNTQLYSSNFELALKRAYNVVLEFRENKVIKANFLMSGQVVPAEENKDRVMLRRADIVILFPKNIRN